MESAGIKVAIPQTNGTPGIQDPAVHTAPSAVSLAPVRVSILTLVFNRLRFIDRAIRSALAQDYQDWELIVVQDGRNPEMEDVVHQWVSRDPRIRYFSLDGLDNIARLYNFGLRCARGEYIAILDDDDYWLVPHKLSRQVAFLDSSPEYVACGGGVLVQDETGKELMRYLKPEQDGSIKKLALVANPMAHSATMFRRRIGGRIVLYDDALGGLPDWDIWLKLGRMGKLHNFAELFTGYTLWKSGVSFTRQKSNARSALRIVWKYRKAYQCFTPAMGLVLLSYIYAFLPDCIRRRSYTYLSCLKKTIFSAARK
jgi:glycosyltransferase involved in cell wall biosynthesis